MVDWYRFRELLFFWLPPCFGVAACFFLLSWGVKMFVSIKKERQISRDVQRAYRYFKRILEHEDEKEDQ